MNCTSCGEHLSSDDAKYLGDTCNRCETERFENFLEEMKVENTWISNVAGRIFSYAVDWNEGRKTWRDEDIENIIKHEMTASAKPSVDACICGHDFATHEHPCGTEYVLGRKVETELGKCKLCACHHWRELKAVREDHASALA